MYSGRLGVLVNMSRTVAAIAHRRNVMCVCARVRVCEATRALKDAVCVCVCVCKVKCTHRFVKDQEVRVALVPSLDRAILASAHFIFFSDAFSAFQRHV